MFNRESLVRKDSENWKKPAIYPVVAPASSSSASSSKKIKKKRINLKDERFVSIARYNRVDNDVEQATIDWIRNQDRIFLNGFSLRFIVDNLKKEQFKKLLSDYLYADMHYPHINDRIAALRELTEVLGGDTSKLKHLSVEQECVLPDSFLVDLHNKLIPIFYNLDAVGKDGKSLYGFSHNAEIELLKEKVRLTSRCFSTEKPQDSAKLLVEIWDNYLFNLMAPDIDRNKYHQIFFQLGHHGGFMFQLFAAHLQSMDSSQYLVRPDECIDQARIEFIVDGNAIYIAEHTPITRVYLCDGETVYAENANKSNVMDLEIRHTISPDDQGNLQLHITFAEAVYHSAKACGVLLAGLFKERLCGYAEYYVQHGHNAEKIAAIFDEAPYIQELTAVKSLNFLKIWFSPSQRMHHDGDKILLYIGMHYPKYAENILADIKKYFDQGEDCFTRVIKLFRRMNRFDLAKTVLLLVLTQPDKADEIGKINQAVEDESKIRSAYHLMVKNGFLSRQKASKPLVEVQADPSHLSANKC